MPVVLEPATRRPCLAGWAVGLSLLLTTFASGQALFEVEAITGPIGATIDVPVTLVNTEPAEGYSFGLQHDPAQLQLVEILPGAGAFAANNGNPPELFFENTNPPGGDGGVVVTAINLSNPAMTIPTGVHEIAIFRYTLIGGPGTTPLSFCECLGTPIVDLTISVLGQTVVPATLGADVTIVAPPQFRRGDFNGDGVVDISDGIAIAKTILGPPTHDCLDAGDVNDDGAFSAILDAVSLISYLFNAVIMDPPPTVMPTPPPPPGTSCGVDPTDDTLDCVDPQPCP